MFIVFSGRQGQTSRSQTIFLLNKEQNGLLEAFERQFRISSFRLPLMRFLQRNEVDHGYG